MTIDLYQAAIVVLLAFFTIAALPRGERLRRWFRRDQGAITAAPPPAASDTTGAASG
jgi:hypothetical protein